MNPAENIQEEMNRCRQCGCEAEWGMNFCDDRCRKLASAIAQRDEARGLLGDIHTWLTAPKMETWQYHENGHFAEDRGKVVRRIEAALAAVRGET